MSSKAIKKLKIDAVEALADKGYYDLDDIEKCERNNIMVYVSKPTYKSSIEDYHYLLINLNTIRIMIHILARRVNFCIV